MISMTNENAELVASPIIPKIVISMIRDMMLRNVSSVIFLTYAYEVLDNTHSHLYAPIPPLEDT